MMYSFHMLQGQPIENSVEDDKLDVYVGYIRIGELVRRYQIPRRDFDCDGGYQRVVSQTRVKTLVRDLKNGIVDLPTSLLLSVRYTGFRPKHMSDDLFVMSLPENGEKPFYVVDGQHRLEALSRLVSENEFEY